MATDKNIPTFTVSKESLENNEYQFPTNEQVETHKVVGYENVIIHSGNIDLSDVNINDYLKFLEQRD